MSSTIAKQKSEAVPRKAPVPAARLSIPASQVQDSDAYERVPRGRADGPPPPRWNAAGDRVPREELVQLRGALDDGFRALFAGLESKTSKTEIDAALASISALHLQVEELVGDAAIEPKPVEPVTESRYVTDNGAEDWASRRFRGHIVRSSVAWKESSQIQSARRTVVRALYDLSRLAKTSIEDPAPLASQLERVYGGSSPQVETERVLLFWHKVKSVSYTEHFHERPMAEALNAKIEIARRAVDGLIDLAEQVGANGLQRTVVEIRLSSKERSFRGAARRSVGL